MGNKLMFLGLVGSLSALFGLAQLAACTSDSGGGAGGAAGSSADSVGGATTGGSSATSTGNGGSSAAVGGSASGNGGSNSSGGSSSGGSTTASGTVCANPVLVDPTKPSIASFDGWDGVAPLSGTGSWSFALGGDTSSGVYAGPFGYGDRKDAAGNPTNLAETFDMVAGANSTKYGLRVADSNAQYYGGGLGIWLSACLNATEFAGISFWTRGNAPSGKATLTLRMQETISSTPAKAGDLPGTCPGTSVTCIQPTFAFTVTDTWTQIQVPWTAFKAGDAAGTVVMPDGRNIQQIQIDIGVNWVPDATGVYVPVPAPYELVSDTWTFY